MIITEKVTSSVNLIVHLITQVYILLTLHFSYSSIGTKHMLLFMCL